ncbi:RNA polymerase sigma-70 factor, ECF subfamily [Streptomyces indicus]|uniref:RNA polymerase sigma factor n=2 Tax=Streptomyces indicus TaxID=417292 RepID=A0A1G8TYH3_9ACTN|nr:RNA polymerase sigma-70 factor, ECF subfamily [Streptomyces indicus]
MTTAMEHPTRTPEQELAELQEAHGRALFGFLLGLTYGDRQRAEDLVQETLVRAWQHPEALRSDHESMRPWLFTVGRRLAIDARRARQARPAEVGAEVIEHAPAAVVGDGHEERSVTALDVREALTTLRREHRDVLVQLYYRGHSVTEAAQALGIPAGTVKSRSHYALRRLRTVLPGYGAGAAR